jgi:hypothetical protein
VSPVCINQRDNMASDNTCTLSTCAVVHTDIATNDLTHAESRPPLKKIRCALISNFPVLKAPGNVNAFWCLQMILQDTQSVTSAARTVTQLCSVATATALRYLARSSRLLDNLPALSHILRYTQESGLRMIMNKQLVSTWKEAV